MHLYRVVWCVCRFNLCASKLSSVEIFFLKTVNLNHIPVAVPKPRTCHLNSYRI